MNGREIEVHMPISSSTARAWKPTRICSSASGKTFCAASTAAFKIAKRTIILDQAVLTAKNISVFL